MTTSTGDYEVLTVTLNPAIDRTVTIANFAAGAVNRVERMVQNPGGKGVNVAATLADAGHRVAVTGYLGRENCASFEDLFAHKGIGDHFVRIAGQTRVGIKIVDPVQGQTTDINFPGPAPQAADSEALLAQLSTIGAAWTVLAGSLPQGVPPTIYGELVALLKARGVRVALDSSGEPLRHALAAAPQFVKPNIHELEALLGTTLPDSAAVIVAATRLLSQGVELVVISMGREGALFLRGDEVVRARPPAVTVQSTVGAGDAMVAGIVASQLRGLSLAETARLATAFSVDAISRIGAGLSGREALEGLMAQVQVEEVAREGEASTA